MNRPAFLSRRNFFILTSICVLAPAALILPARLAGPGVIEVDVEVDFGPLDKPALERKIRLKKGSTVVDATKALVDLRQAYVCCDMNDVETIGGVKCDPENEGWWLYDINGEKGPVSAYRCLLADGDRVSWRYVVMGSLYRKGPTTYRVTGPGPGAVVGKVSVSGRIPDLPPYAVHKNETFCGRSPQKPNACARPSKGPGLSKAVAWLSGLESGKNWIPFPDPVLNQRDCQFIPHLLVARRGSILKLASEDSVLHNVHAVNSNHKTLFNVAMPNTASHHQVSLDETGVWDVQCDAGHRWMKAHLVVVENPYWALTGEDGTYRISGVPPGTYRLNVWHDYYGLKTRNLTLGEGEMDGSVAFSPEKFRLDLRYAEAK